jgi:hypothetical protein
VIAQYLIPSASTNSGSKWIVRYPRALRVCWAHSTAGCGVVLPGRSGSSAGPMKNLFPSD